MGVMMQFSIHYNQETKNEDYTNRSGGCTIDAKYESKK
jgi:hypothetical protein